MRLISGKEPGGGLSGLRIEFLTGYNPDEKPIMRENNPLRAEPTAAARMHPDDRRLLALFNWAGNVGGALLVGCYIGWAINQMPLRLAAPGMAFGLLLMSGATIYALRESPPKRRGYFLPIIIGAIVLTWALFGWQTWMWFHPVIGGPSQAQLDEAFTKGKAEGAKPIQEKLDQANREIETLRQSPQATDTKMINTLRSQIGQLQSDAPVTIDKLPTSLRLVFNATGIEKIEAKNIATWARIPAWREQPSLLPRSPQPVLAILMVFKKPVTFNEIYIDGHGTDYKAEATIDPHFAIVQFEYPYLSGSLT
jgi:hypothetical protein